MAAAEAYFDESGTGDEWPYICVAGYIFTLEAREALKMAWQQLLDRYALPYFHMTDCAHGHGPFRQLSRDQRIAAQTEAIDLIGRFASKGIALSIDKDAFDDLPPDGLWTSPYSFLCGQVVFGVQRWAKETGHTEGVHYFYEHGADGWGAASRDLARFVGPHEGPRRDVQYLTHAHVHKRESAAVQCADILAWHWHTHNRRRREGNRKRRADFQALLRACRVDPHHYDRDSIAVWRQAWVHLAPHIQGPQKAITGEVVHSSYWVLRGAGATRIVF